MSPKKSKKQQKISIMDEEDGNLFVKGLSKMIIKDFNEAEEIIRTSLKYRSTVNKQIIISELIRSTNHPVDHT